MDVGLGGCGRGWKKVGGMELGRGEMDVGGAGVMGQGWDGVGEGLGG